jgi:hypothetical protein
MDGERLRELYRAFNARELDAVLAQLAEDVDWPTAYGGGRAVGRDAVRAYWTRQWAEIDPTVEPGELSTLPDGRIAVEVEQTVQDLDGNVVASGRVTHVYTLRDGLVARMDIESP